MDPNIFTHPHEISRKDRNKLTGNRSVVVWFTGLSGSGKSTLANNLEKKLHHEGILTYILDGDNIRNGLNKDLDFSDAGRTENIRRIGEVAKLMHDAGLIVLTAFISPFKKDREFVRGLIQDDFVEVYVKCDLEVCRERDVKGLYKKAGTGAVKNFTGVDSLYEAPENADVIVDTSASTIEECTDKIYDHIKPLIMNR